MIHALVVMTTYGEARRKALRRFCPRCGHEQLTSEERLNGWVSCEKCKTPIPPKPGAVLEEPNTEDGA